MLNLLIIALGGGAGAVARYLLSGWVQHRTGSFFPWGTFAVNLAGCLLLGLLMGLVQGRPLAISPAARNFLAIGILGAFTTFSTFSYETAALVADGEWSAAILNAAGQLILGLAAVFAGLTLARLVAS